MQSFSIHSIKFISSCSSSSLTLLFFLSSRALLYLSSIMFLAYYIQKYKNSFVKIYDKSLNVRKVQLKFIDDILKRFVYNKLSYKICLKSSLKMFSSLGLIFPFLISLTLFKYRYIGKLNFGNSYFFPFRKRYFFAAEFYGNPVLS